MTVKDFILANYSNIDLSITEEVRLTYSTTFNTHLSTSDVMDAINEILNPPIPSIEELNTMTVTQLNDVIDKYSLDVDKSMLKADKLAEITILLYPIEGGE